MLKNFRSYQLAKALYNESVRTFAPGHLRNQLLRASSSVVLNLAEAEGRGPGKDRIRFYRIAYGSLKEVQAILDLINARSATQDLADHVGASIFRLIQATTIRLES